MPFGNSSSSQEVDTVNPTFPCVTFLLYKNGESQNVVTKIICAVHLLLRLEEIIRSAK